MRQGLIFCAYLFAGCDRALEELPEQRAAGLFLTRSGERLFHLSQYLVFKWYL